MRSGTNGPRRGRPAELLGATGRWACTETPVWCGPQLSAVAVAVALLVSACGGGSPSTTPSSSTGASSAASRFLSFAGCMRTRGVASYPDPQVTSAGNHVSVKIGPGAADPNSPAFRSANQACRHFLPNGGLPAPASSGQLAQDVTFADCMRSHGVPSFPDPDHDGVFTLPAAIDPQAPQVQRAQRACTSVEPSSLSVNQSRPG